MELVLLGNFQQCALMNPPANRYYVYAIILDNRVPENGCARD